MKSSTLSVGEVAERFGLATHVLRHWESVGLLEPARAGGRRRYDDNDLHRIAIILRSKEAGLSLDGIREMFGKPSERESILKRHKEELERRIAAAQASLTIVDCALGCEHDDFTRCAHFREAVARARPAPPSRLSRAVRASR
ncbi:MerR family transcriptional regulator [Amycolatopsis roodepoortensis]|uniref:DNA-binding transcriptional MerR regulator n=1 Tax=Amycolatopsis roodepoortensis TaxID=700274 RepID=A0ABR9KZP3_9PSEU|nr:MerR family transcriptional regulator [Amycolatopsis roodepoortensis]MBE1573418.1 DNA-binding transcriptional MerR regulator [Amycolatopsis roodepoortensis]